MEKSEIQVRRAGVAESEAAAQLLHDFNAEYDEPTPEVPVIAERLNRLLAAGDIHVLLAGDGPDGIAVFLLRPSIWEQKSEAYLAELYVRPELRGRGIGKALLEATMDAARRAGAGMIDLNTGTTDTEARGLYESHGFTNREGGPDGPSMLYYEREL